MSDAPFDTTDDAAASRARQAANPDPDVGGIASLTAIVPNVAKGSPAATGWLSQTLEQAAAAQAPLDCRHQAAVAGSLARLRQKDIEPSARVIIVNVASGYATAYEQGEAALHCRAIVGKTRTRTPSLVSHIPSVRLNPPWTVPPSIERYLPESRKRAMRRVGAHLVLPPGPSNPLGPVRLGLAASDGIYLHGTSDPSLFERDIRTLSYGCVRLEKAVAFAAWALDTTEDALHALIRTGRTQEITPQRPVRVILAYLTAWTDQEGKLHLLPDPYRLDAGRRCP